MAPTQFAVGVMVSGGERRLKIEGNPIGRTIIVVDGVTTYDKKPFVHKETIDFDIVPGKKASLRWQQVSLTGLECDVTVDGHTTTLPSVAQNGAVAKAVSPKQREEFKMRATGATFLLLGVGSVLFNYLELQSGAYWAKLLIAAPALLIFGSVFLLNPRIDAESPAKKKIYVAAALALIIAGWFFKGWFVGTFGPQ